LFGPFDNFFSESQAGKNKAVFGGVQYVATETENLARLRWDTNRVDAVAVDGQHRLRALKMWMERKNNQLSDFEAPTRVPVLFLMLHERAGFKTAPNTSVTSIKAIAREIFTDLNKNAKEVDVATEIILDDLSVEACCVRALITPTTCTDSEQLLPLSLLRWQEANTRFDQKYYLNSIVNLHLIVKELLGFKQFDAMSKSDVLDFIKSASALLGSGESRQLVHNGVTLENYYLQNFCEDGEDQPVAPFSGIPQHYLNAAVEGFKERFAPWLLKILTKFEPYAQILSYARSNRLLTGEFSQYLSQPRAHQMELAKDLGHKYGEQWMDTVIEQHNRAIEKFKGIDGSELGEQWAFKTIFQKAVVRLARILFITSPADQRDKLGTVDDYLNFLNKLHTSGVFRVHANLGSSKHGLWVFLAVTYGGKKIKVREGLNNSFARQQAA
jgi:hypothetical protein